MKVMDSNVEIVTEEVFVAPASFAQRRLWFLHQLDPASAAYNMPAAVLLEGRLEVDALERTFKEIIRRHESLRTSFTTIDQELMQVVVAERPFHIKQIDLSTVPESEREAEVQRHIREESERPFNLENNEALRITLLRLTAEETVMVVVMNHINSDGWSIGVLVKEMVTLYEAFIRGEPSPLPELEIQYLDFAQWQKEWLTGNVLEEQLGYWKQTLGGRLPVLDLAGDVTRPARRTYNGANEIVQLPLDLSVKLKELSRERGATLFMTLLAAFDVLMHRYTGQEDILVGTPVAGRARPETENLIGFFVNTLVLRNEVTDDLRFSDLLARVRETALEAQVHADIPFEMLVEELQPERNLTHTPIFQVMFVLLNTPLPELKMAGLRMSELDIDETRSKFDLTLSLKEKPAGLKGSLQYSTERFTRERIQRMIGHFTQLLEGIVADPDKRIGDLPLLTAAERQQILVEWNDTQASFERDHCLHTQFEEQAARTPERVAVVYGDRQITYAELDARANQLAHYLRRLGVGLDTPVVVCLDRSIEMVVALLGVLKAGAAYVPLDPSHPRQRLAFTLSDTQAPVLVTQANFAAQLPPQSAHVLCLDKDWESISRESEVSPGVSVAPANLAYVLYTSGSTGQPKGVLITHHAISNHMFWMQRDVPLSETDRVLQKTPLTFDASVWEFYLPLMCGAQLVMARPGGHQDSAYLVGAIIEHEITVLQLVPTMLRVLHAEKNISRCRSLERVFCGGEALTYDLQERFNERLEGTLHNLYGPTEAAVDATFWKCSKDDERQVVPIGRPIANTQIYLLDKQLQPVPVGVAAELYIGGEGLGRGYFNRADLTSDRFIPNPFRNVAGARLYRTGDMCRHLADGTIEYLGRSDHQVKLRGFRIELGEIESALSQYEGVDAALVVVREDSSGDQKLVAYVIATEENSPRAEELRNYLRERLPTYMIPAAFVALSAFPLLPNGKVDRNALPEPDAGSLVKDEYVAPETPHEIKVAEIWAEVLGVDRIGRSDNFFDLGGHSLLATRVVARLNDVFGTTVSLQTVFEKPTLAQFALVVEQTENQQAAIPRIKSQPRLRKNLTRVVENVDQVAE
jgi:amino acid adenylation domain-containing protein